MFLCGNTSPDASITHPPDDRWMVWSISEMVTEKENEIFETSVTSSTTSTYALPRDWSQNFVDGSWWLTPWVLKGQSTLFNPLTPNDHYSGRTAPLTCKRCILYIYSTNIGTQYFKHRIHSPFLSLQTAVCFTILTYLVPVLFTFCIQSVLK